MSNTAPSNKEHQFGKRIQLERQRLGIRQSDCAKIAGFTHSAQSEWENNETIPNASMLMVWSKIGMDVHFIVTGQYSLTPACQDVLSAISLSSKNNPFIYDLLLEIITVIEKNIDCQLSPQPFSSSEEVMQNEACAFGARVREERSRLRLKQIDLSTHSQTSRFSQLAWETGQRFPDLTVLDAWEKIGFDIPYLITGERTTCCSSDKEQAVVNAGYNASPQTQVLLRHLIDIANNQSIILSIQVQPFKYFSLCIIPYQIQQTASAKESSQNDKDWA